MALSWIENGVPSKSYSLGTLLFSCTPFFHQKETLRKEGRYVLLNYSNSSLIRSKELFPPFLKLNDRTNERIMLTRKMSRYLSNINSKRDSFSRTYSSLYFSRYLRTSWNTFTSIQGLRRRVVTRMTYVKGSGDVINLLVWHFGWLRGKACQKPEHNIPLKLDA